MRFDPGRRYVRETGRRDNGLVEFTFAIGEPDLFVELILPAAAFAAFCAANAAEILPPRAPGDETAAAPRSDWDWRLADARTTHFR